MFGKFEFNPRKDKGGKEPGMEEAVQKLNEKIAKDRTPEFEPVKSVEEKVFIENFGNKFSQLQEQYFQLQQEILDRERELAEMRMQKNAISNRAKRLTFNELAMKHPNQTLRDMTRNAEDRMEILARKIKNREGDLGSLQNEFKEVKKTWEAIVGMVAVTEEDFDPTLN